jgi:hypothetical protein
MLTFQGFATPAMLASGYIDVLGPEDGFTFIPPTTTCCLLSTPSPSLRLLGEGPETPCLGLLLRRGDRTKGTMNVQEPDDCTKA